MKFLICLLILLNACKEVNNTTVNNPGPESSSNVEYSDLTGYFYLEDTGNLEIVELDNGSYVLYGTQRIVSDNADASLALFPSLSSSAHAPIDGVIVGSTNLSYNTNHNLKRDSDNTLITGSRLTKYEIKKVDDKLVINIKVFGTNNITVECDRQIKEL